MNSINIKVMSEEIQRIKDKLHAIDVEVPDPSQATDGQILSVDDGKYVISDPELPATTEAATGDVLGLTGEGKAPGWITPFTPPSYVLNEDVDTGVKTEDGEAIYKRKYTFTTPESGTSTVFQRSDINLLTFDLYVTNASGNLYNMFNVGGPAPQFTNAGDFVISAPTSAAFQGQTGYMYITFTKPAPTPIPGNREPDEEPEETKKVTRKKSTK